MEIKQIDSSDVQIKIKNNMSPLSLITMLLSVIPLAMGFYKMYVYESNEGTYATPKNAYVGGDAYNMIISSNYSTGFFVLFATLFIGGLLIEIISRLKAKI